jgi:hypothetical protein
MPILTLRPAQGHRRGDWGPDDYDVLDGERDVGASIASTRPHEVWWWGVDFMLTYRKSYGNAPTREEAMATFKAEYEQWLQEQSP